MRTLGWIAIGGLGIGIASLSLAYALGGRDLHRLPFDLASGASCGEVAKGSPSVRRLAWDNGDAIELSLPGTVTFRGGQGSEIVVRGSPDLVAHVEVRGSRLVLDCHGWTAGRDLEITLPGRAFRDIRLSGSSKLVMENVSQPDLDLRISGSGTVRAQGSVDQATIKVSGSGEARLGDLAMKQLTVDISGSGKVEAAPKDSADVRISGSGDVKLLSRPANLTSKVSGSGRISQVPKARGETLAFAFCSLCWPSPGYQPRWPTARSFHAGITRITVQDTTPFDALIAYPTEAAEVSVEEGPFRLSASRDAPVAAGARFPVVLFSHGGGRGPGTPLVHRDLLLHLARQGFIVIAPFHPGNRAAFRRSAATDSQGARFRVGGSTLFQTRRSRPDRHGGLLFRRRGDAHRRGCDRSIWRTCRPIAVIIPTIPEPAKASPPMALGQGAAKRNRTTCSL